MSTRLKNGAVLPSGLLTINNEAAFEGFKKSYQNNSLRFGVVIATYPKGDSDNVTGLATEYDVMIFEQNENKSATPITYKNCLSSEGLGSIADFFEKTLRVQTRESSNADTKNQDGAVVIVLCLNGTSDKGIIIGALTHPDRTSTLVDAGPHLEGEFNGVNIKVNADGSTSLTFNSATDNNGKVISPPPAPTVMSIEKDGSYQIGHKTITQRFDAGGVASLTAQDNITNNTQKSFSVTAGKDATISASSGNFNVTAQQMALSITGSAGLSCASGTVSAIGSYGIKAATFTAEAQGLASIKAPIVVIEGQVSLGGQGGLPILTLGTTFLGLGNLGIPVISRAISGFSNKVTAQ